MKYTVAWLKSLDLLFNLNYCSLHIVILFITIYFNVSKDGNIAKDIPTIHILINLPKYGFAFTNDERYFFRNSQYRFYKKKLFKGIITKRQYNFYILHVVGDEPIEIEGKESVWDKR